MLIVVGIGLIVFVSTTLGVLGFIAGLAAIFWLQRKADAYVRARDSSEDDSAAHLRRVQVDPDSGRCQLSRHERMRDQSTTSISWRSAATCSRRAFRPALVSPIHVVRRPARTPLRLRT